ncbi:MAG: glucosamine-6-phosphate deaminase [bacterium]|nr:MAG: glucosamine-6-phosphate deaminase [bacterium]
MNLKKKFIFESSVEKIAFEKSGYEPIYPPIEKIPVIIVDNFPDLGKLTAIRFLEWVQQNPEGVISLPTGKTPEHFIKWIQYYLRNWDQPDIHNELKNWGIDPTRKASMKGLRFVQIDEFYPINPQLHNSFYHYINHFYIKGFGLDKSKALLMDAYRLGVPEDMTLESVFPEEKIDLTLRTRQASNKLERSQKQVIEAVDQYCTEYETRIREMGGIGFFLGGIGPDGHIGFNVKGSDHYSTTRLTPTNYETQAAAATDMGGIEVARNRLVITMGLRTITFNKDAVAIIIAAGEAKAKIVSEAVQNETSNLYPATVLHSLPEARFYLTRGAAKFLVERRFVELSKKEKINDEDVQRIVINLSLIYQKSISELSNEDFKNNKFGKEILKKTQQKSSSLIESVHKQIYTKIEDGIKAVEGEVFMHTAPHHDDIMLGFWPFMVHLVRSPQNKHYFNYMTSGFTAVTNKYVLGLLKSLNDYIDTPLFSRLLSEGYFDPENENGRDGDVSQYLDGIVAHSRTLREEAESKRLLRNLVFLFEEDSLHHLKHRIVEMINYLKTQYPGKKDIHYIQQIKGMIREWEADLLWAYLGFNYQSVNHLRLGFYKGEIFTEEPDIQRDVQPVLNLIEKINPTVITVALDPESSGPDTHYKVLQAITEALKMYEKRHGSANVKIWGYRNVWFRFHPAEATTYVPVSLNSFASLDFAFMNCFGSQRSASFPSYEFDGPFSRLAQRIMVEQYQQVKTCLGQNYFLQNDHPRLRAAHGFNFLKKMTLPEFYQHSMELRKTTENR